MPVITYLLHTLQKINQLKQLARQWEEDNDSNGKKTMTAMGRRQWQQCEEDNDSNGKKTMTAMGRKQWQQWEEDNDSNVKKTMTAMWRRQWQQWEEDNDSNVKKTMTGMGRRQWQQKLLAMVGVTRRRDGVWKVGCVYDSIWPVQQTMPLHYTHPIEELNIFLQNCNSNCWQQFSLLNTNLGIGTNDMYFICYKG